MTGLSRGDIFTAGAPIGLRTSPRVDYIDIGSVIPSRHFFVPNAVRILPSDRNGGVADLLLGSDLPCRGERLVMAGKGFGENIAKLVRPAVFMADDMIMNLHPGTLRN
jgi:hypothetical protein